MKDMEIKIPHNHKVITDLKYKCGIYNRSVPVNESYTKFNEIIKKYNTILDDSGDDWFYVFPNEKTYTLFLLEHS